MTMQDAVRSVFRNYATFSGRARRSEFWWWTLFSFLVSVVLSLLDGALFGGSVSTVADGETTEIVYYTPGILGGIWSLATLLPTLAVAARRLHDTGRSGWWLLLFLIPLIGTIILIVWFATRGRTGTNRYGADPIGFDG